MKLAKPDGNHSETENILKQRTNKCKAGQRFTVPPVRFKNTVLRAENLVFFDEILIYLVFIDNAPILHFADTATLFSALTFLDKHGETYGQSVDGT